MIDRVLWELDTGNGANCKIEVRYEESEGRLRDARLRSQETGDGPSVAA